LIINNALAIVKPENHLVPSGGGHREVPEEVDIRVLSLLDLPLDDFKSIWTGLVGLAASLFNFD
jgi:hypothetical protein